MTLTSALNHSSAMPPATDVNAVNGDRLHALKHELHQQISESIELSRSGEMPEAELHAESAAAAGDLSRKSSDLLSLSEYERLVNEMIDESFGLVPLEPLLNDPAISDILMNKPKTIDVERGDRLELSDVPFSSEQHRLQIIQKTDF